MQGPGRPTDNQILALKGNASTFHAPPGFHDVTAFGETSTCDILRVYASPATTLRIFSDPRTDVHTYLWGLASHPEVNRSEIPRWIAGQIASGHAASFRQVSGSYIGLIEDRQSGSVSIVSDVAGTRPFFAGMRQDTLVCGSEVWTLAELGLITRRLNFDAIAAWIRAGYDFTEGSLFSDVSLVEPGAVTTFCNDKSGTLSYVDFQGGCRKPALDEFLDAIHSIMTRSFRTATRELARVQLAMSGGFDSRYLAALAVEHGLDVRAACLDDKPPEGRVAAEVARRLGLPLQMIETDGSKWNAYESPFHFTPSGFPITKQQSYLAARLNPGIPCLNGFLGGELLRDTVDRLEGKLPSETTDPPRFFQRAQTLLHDVARFDLMERDVVNRCDERTLPACRRHIARYANTANAFAAAMSLRRHRGYFGNNFVQHLSFAEPILPFASFDLIQQKCQTHPDCFTWENHQALFSKFHPMLADIPHNEKTGDKADKNPPRSAATRRWASKALQAILAGRLSILDQRKTVPRLIGALHGAHNTDAVAQFAYRLHLLESRLLDIDVELNWSAI